MKGFTFIEIILVVALLLVLGTMGTAFGSRFLTQNAVTNVQDQLIADVRKAQFNAMMGKQNSNWGVNYGSNMITLYKGNSYAARDSNFDERFSVNAGVSVSGISDINFTKTTGNPNTTASITISGSGETKQVIVNEYGMVTR